MMEKRRFLPVAAIAAVALVAAACSSSDDHATTGGGTPDGTALAFADVMAGTAVAPGTYNLTDVSDAFQAELEAYVGPTDGYMTGDTVTIGGILLTCAVGPCSVAVAPDGSHFTTTGTIYTAGYTPPAPNPLASLDAMAVAGAIGTTVPTAFDTNSPFTVAAGEVAKQTNDDGDDFEMSDASPADLGEGWAGAIHTRTTDEDDDMTDADETVTEMVVSYTNVEDPTDQAYSEYYSTTLANSRDGVQSAVADGELTLSEDQTGYHELFSIAFGITAPHQTVPIDHDDPDTMDVTETESEFEGMFNNIPGTFKCENTCSVTSDDMGNLITLTGTWTFAPTVAEDGELADIMVAGVVDDTDYLDFGFWIVTSQGEDGPEYTVGIFQDGMREHNGNVAGKAEYAGPATGVYMTKTFDPGTGDPIPQTGGQFTAHAALTAYFGAESTVPQADHNSISGTISDFYNSDGEMIDDEWEVELMRATISGGAFTAGVTSTGEGSEPGAWDGQFYGPPTDAADDPVMPDSVAGTFNAHFSNGHAAGAFGATVVEEDE